MTFDFPTLVAHVAKTRELEAGSIVGSGTVSNKEAGGPGRPAATGGVGYSCIAEQRTVETLLAGKPSTPFLRFGDRVRIEMHDAAGRTIFGAIDQRSAHRQSFGWRRRVASHLAARHPAAPALSGVDPIRVRFPALCRIGLEGAKAATYHGSCSGRTQPPDRG
jgi:hypothetical protein